MRKAVECAEKRYGEWGTFAYNIPRKYLPWIREGLEITYFHSLAGFDRKYGRKAAEILDIYRLTVGKSLEERLPADLKEDVFDGDWSIFPKKGSKKKNPKTECEKAHQKGFEEGFDGDGGTLRQGVWSS